MKAATRPAPHLPSATRSAPFRSPSNAPLPESSRAAMRIPLWVDLRHIPINKRLGILHAVDEMAAEHVLLAKGDPHLQRDGLRPLLVDGHNRIRQGGATVGRVLKVRDARSQARAAEAEGIVVVEADDWRVIPLENLVAARADRPGTLYALARTPEEAQLFAQVLETGVHGIVLAAQGPADLFATDRLLRDVHRPAGTSMTNIAKASAATATMVRPVAPDSAPGPMPAAATARTHAIPPVPPPTTVPKSSRTSTLGTSQRSGTALPAGLDLVAATVTRIADGGMADRVCVDCTTLFHEGEGLLVGSTARSFLLVHAETSSSDLIAPRPFRVNAGAVHSYVLAPGGRTRYLSELGAGDEALAVDRKGQSRVATIGRSKVERRPHTIVHWQGPNGEGSAVLQTAETVRLVRPDGTLVAVPSLAPGDKVLVHDEAAARHFGMPIEESLEER